MLRRPTTRQILSLTRGAYDRRMAGAGQFRRGGRGGGRPARKPVTLQPTSASNVLWLRPEEAYVTRDGSNNVSGVTDRGPAGNNASQGTSAQQPLWTASSANFNGHPSITHDASNSEHLRADGVASTFSGTDRPFTVLMAAKLVSAPPSTTEDFCAAGNTGSATQYHQIIQAKSTSKYQVGKRDNDNNPANIEETGTSVDAAVHVFAVVHTGTAVSLYLDGTVLAGIDGAAQDVGACTFDTFAIGAWVNTSIAVPANIEWADLAVYDGALSDADRQLVEADWTTRYGL